MMDKIYQLCNIRHIKLFLYHDNIFVGSITEKYKGQEFIRSKKYGCYILPKTSIPFLIHGIQYRINYNVGFITPLKPKYNKVNFFAILKRENENNEKMIKNHPMYNIKLTQDINDLHTDNAIVQESKSRRLLNELSVMRKKLWEGINDLNKLSPEYLEELESRLYTDEDIISMMMTTITPLELEHLTNGEDAKNIMHDTNKDMSWVLPVVLVFTFGIIAIMVLMKLGGS